MHDTAIVTSIETKDGHEKITVIPLIKDACLNCKTGCAKRGNPFEAINPAKLPVKVNSVVKIGSSKKSELVQLIISVGIPTFFAVAAYFASTFLPDSVFGKISQDGKRAFFALAGFAAGAFLVYFSVKKQKKPAQPEITEICF